MSSYISSSYSKMGLSPQGAISPTGGGFRRNPVQRGTTTRRTTTRNSASRYLEDIGSGATQNPSMPSNDSGDSETGRIGGPRIDLNMGGAEGDPMAEAQKKMRDREGEMLLHGQNEWEKAMSNPEPFLSKMREYLGRQPGQTEKRIDSNIQQERQRLAAAQQARSGLAVDRANRERVARLQPKR